MKSLWQDIRDANTSWLVIWSLIYLSFLLGDLLTPGFFGVTVIKLLGLFICFSYAAHKSPDDRLLLLALGFTILSDLILAANNIAIWGIATFCIAHFFHMARLVNFEKSSNLLPPYLAGAVLIFIAGYLIKIPPIIILGFIYAVTIISNLALAARWHFTEPKSKPARHAFFGFLLFIACDLCVAVSYFSFIGVFPALFYAVANYFAWAFYFPSQIFICSSGKSVIQ